MIVIRPRIRIVATILAKNEEDIIGRCIEHNINQGVSKIILTDNSSTDRTREIAEGYPEVEIIDEPGDDHNQSLWVTRMARIACQFNPDWIVHLDADELWCGLARLQFVNAQIAKCERMFLHPPVGVGFDVHAMRHYLDFDKIPISQECKIAHRPDNEITIAHGNHDVLGSYSTQNTVDIYRHHYPIRSYEQWVRKANGHISLAKRNAICSRWENWYKSWEQGELERRYGRLVDCWRRFISDCKHSDLITLLECWSTPEVINFFRSNPNFVPEVGEWPKPFTEA